MPSSTTAHPAPPTRAARAPRRDAPPAVNPPRCLVVDDDAPLRTAVCDYLAGFGFDSRAAASGAQLQAELARSAVDLVVLDARLPDADGLALCAALRRHSMLPVILLAAEGDAASRVLGLELGADDCLGKPFEMRELVARAKAVLRRHAPGPAQGRAPAVVQVLEFEGWRFDRVRQELLSPRQALVPLSNAECRLLRAFAEHPKRVLSRERLIDLTRRPGAAVNSRSIDLAVSRLRQKLGASRSGGPLIHTVRGAGYRFDVDIRLGAWA
jgi:two-component system OmpR family response regulator